MHDGIGTKQGKVWGTTRCLFRKNNAELHRLSINKGGYSSKHRHLHKYNAFYVETGKLLVRIWKADYDLCDETTLEAGEYMTVDPLEFHQFEALEDCIVLEVYWTELDGNDIERETVGGEVE